jgi:ABC-type multidrug transport system ATPase subunit
MCQVGYYCLNNIQKHCLFGTFGCPSDNLTSPVPFLSNIYVFLVSIAMLYILKFITLKIKKHISHKIEKKGTSIPLVNYPYPFNSFYCNLYWKNLNDDYISESSGYIAFNDMNIIYSVDKKASTNLLSCLFKNKKHDGHIYFKNEKIFNINKEIKVSFVENINSLVPELTFVENLCLNYLMHNDFIYAVEQHIHTHISEYELNKYKGKIENFDQINELDKFKINLLIQLVKNPDIIVVDDCIINSDTISILTKLTKNGKTVIISSDKMDFIEQFKNYIIMKNKQIIFSGNSEDYIKYTDKIGIEGNFHERLEHIDSNEINKFTLSFPVDFSYYSGNKKNRYVNSVVISFVKRFLATQRDTVEIIIYLLINLVVTSFCSFFNHDSIYISINTILIYLSLLINLKSTLILDRIEFLKSTGSNIKYVYFGESLSDMFYNNIITTIILLSWFSGSSLNNSFIDIYSLVTLFCFVIEEILILFHLKTNNNYVKHMACFIIGSFILSPLLKYVYLVPTTNAYEMVYKNEITKNINYEFWYFMVVGFITKIVNYFYIKKTLEKV